MKPSLYALAFVFLLFGCKKDKKTNDENISGITIGTQVWEAKNLDVTTYRNGDPIPQITDSAEWVNATTGGWCYYQNNPGNDSVYGKLYNWYAVNDPRGLAPQGWHLPTNDEWLKLVNFLGGRLVSGGKMKATTLWNTPNRGATNSSNFGGLPGGGRDFIFVNQNAAGYWWSTTPSTDHPLKVWGVSLDALTETTGQIEFEKFLGLSVRCVKD